VLSYTVAFDGRDKAKVTVWLDAKTKLPLKRKFEALEEKDKGQYFVETYSEFVLNPTLDAKKFELPSK
jgi:hypothetical protein